MAVFIGPILTIFIMMKFPDTEGQYFLVRAFVETFIGGFASVCFGKLIFGIIGVHYDSSVVLWIGIFFLCNCISGFFIKNSSNEVTTVKVFTVKVLGGIGVLCGVVIAGILLK